ncbi:MAG: hypothetical protein ACI3XC_06865 [Phascolarctobacterium sp.]
MTFNSSLAEKLSSFYNSDQYKNKNTAFWDDKELYGKIVVSPKYHIWVYKTSKDGMEFVYLHKISPRSNQAIALPIFWVSDNNFEFTKFLFMDALKETQWPGGFFDKMLFLTHYVLRPTYTIEVYRTFREKYEYIFLNKYNNTTKQALAIPASVVHQISILIRTMVGGDLPVPKVDEKVECKRVINGAAGIGIIKKVDEVKKICWVSFGPGSMVKLNFGDIKKV